MPSEALQLERLVETRKSAAQRPKPQGFSLTYPSPHFPVDLSDFFDEMVPALQDHAQSPRTHRLSAMARAPLPAAHSSYGPRREGEISRSPAKAVLANRPPRSGGHPPAARCPGSAGGFGLIAARSHDALLPRAAYSRASSALGQATDKPRSSSRISL